MKVVFNINEITAAYFFLLALTNRRPYVLAIDPFFPLTKCILQAVVDWAIKAGRARWVVDLCPELEREWEYPVHVHFHNMYAEMEEWLDDYYGLDKVDSLSPDYARAYKQVACLYASSKRLSMLSAHTVLTKERIKIVGLPVETVAAIEAYWGRPIGLHAKPMWVPNAFFNFFTSFLIMVFSIGWVLSRLRFTKITPQYFFFAADFQSDRRDFGLLQEMAEGGPVLLVRRNAQNDPDKFEELKSYSSCLPSDGCFSVIGTLDALRFVILDSIKLYIHYHSKPSALFLQVAAFPYRRAVLRAFFTQVQAEVFLGA